MEKKIRKGTRRYKYVLSGVYTFPIIPIGTLLWSSNALSVGDQSGYLSLGRYLEGTMVMKDFSALKLLYFLPSLIFW